MGSFSKAKEAWAIYKSLTKEDKFELHPFIRNIRGVQERISEAEDGMDAKTECKKCRGACCFSGIGGLIDKVNYLYTFWTVSRLEREDIWTAFKKDSTDKNCRFQGRKGCVIPRDSRPHVCRTFFCDKNRDLQNIIKIFRPSLYERFKIFENELAGRGYKF